MGRRTAIADVVERCESATLLLHSDEPARWSVVDDRGRSMVPRRCAAQVGGRFRPYFHGNDIELDVPAAPLTVTVARGIEYDATTLSVHPRPGSREEVRLHRDAATIQARRGGTAPTSTSMPTTRATWW